MRSKRIKEVLLKWEELVKFQLDPITKKPTGVYFKEQKMRIS
jgi:hypothetical protein